MDIRIVGGGLAGMVTGIQVLTQDADAGHRVTVYERGPAITTTLCGEGLSDTTLARLDWPGFDHRPFIGASFRGAAWSIACGKRVTLPDACHTMDRARWIPAMAEHLERLGGVILTGQSLSQGDVRALPGDLVVGADGPGSVVRRVIGGNVETRLGIQYRVTDADYETDRLVFHTDKRYSPEYSWIFPRGDLDNVGLLAREDRDDWKRLDRFMEDWKVGGHKARKEAYPIAFNGDKVQDGRYALIGDAAGLTNPVTKGGMAAIVYASEILAACVRERRVEEYGPRVERHPIKDPVYARALKIIVETPDDEMTRWARFLPDEVALGERRAGTDWRLAAKSALGNLARLNDLRCIYRALGLSRHYSW